MIRLVLPILVFFLANIAYMGPCEHSLAPENTETCMELNYFEESLYFKEIHLNVIRWITHLSNIFLFKICFLFSQNLFQSPYLLRPKRPPIF